MAKTVFKMLPFAELFQKCKELKGKEVLHSSFASDRYFTIHPAEDGYIITEYKNKLSYQRNGQKISKSFFDSRNELQSSVQLNPEWYARDSFTQKISHLDRWENFINSFSKKTLEKSEPHTPTGHAKYEYVSVDESNGL